jgi:hypothetical protein
MTVAPVRRAPRWAARRPTDSQASLRGALRRPCRAASSPAGVARSGGNLPCRSVGGLSTASEARRVRRPWAQRGMDGRSGRTYTIAVTRPMRATLTRSPLLTSDSARAPSRRRKPVTHAPAGATGSNCSHASRGLRFAARDSSLHLYGGRVGERPSRAAAAASSRLAKS